MNTLFSIVIPVYNYGHTVERCVNSVLSQNNDATMEIILVNDGSTDNSHEVCQSLESSQPGLIKYHRQENQGPSKARNTGVDLSSGQYITFLDADDEMTEQALENIANSLTKSHINKPHVLLGGHLSIKDGVESQHPAPAVHNSPTENFLVYLIKKELPISNGAIYFHRSLFDKVQFPEDLRNSEDIPVFSLALANYPCLRIGEYLVKVHKHRDSLRNQTDLAVQSGLKVVERIFDHQELPKELQAYRNTFKAIRLLSLFRTLYNGGQFKEARRHYIQAVKLQPSLFFRFSYLSKFIRSLFQ